MVDLFTLITGVAGLISLAIELSKITSEFVGSVKRAPESIRDLSQELLSLNHVLGRLDIFLKTQDNLGSFAETAALISTEQFCLTRLKNMYEKLRRSTEGGKMRRMAWPFSEKENKETILALYRCSQTFELSLSVEGCALLSQTSEKVEKTLQVQISTFEEAQKITGIANAAVSNFLLVHKSIVQFLKLLDVESVKIQHISDRVDQLAKHAQGSPSKNLEDALGKHEATTSEWLSNGLLFTNWKDHPGSLLWLYGIIGCGKTILCSTIIQYLDNHCQQQSASDLAYFYFDFADKQKQETNGFLRSIIHQLSVRTVGNAVQSLYTRCHSGLDPTETVLKQTLRLLISELSTVFIVVDALDECSEQDKLFAILTDLKKCDNAHILVTSREEECIGKPMAFLCPTRLSLTETMIRHDIDIYIERRLSRNSKLTNWSKQPKFSELKTNIQSALRERAHGMFQWVACQLNELEQCCTVRDLKNTLRYLPKTLEETYERILIKMNCSDKPIALRIFQWLLFSSRPLSLKEIAEALCYSASDAQDSWGSQRSENELSSPNDVLRICSSLVKLVPRDHARGQRLTYLEQEDGVESEHEEGKFGSSFSWAIRREKDNEQLLQLAHSSVKEYLLRPNLLNKLGYLCQEPTHHLNMAETCLAYLLQFSHHEDLLDSIYEETPLAEYAAMYWISHAQRIDEASDWTRMKLLSWDLLRPSASVYRIWIRLLYPSVEAYYKWLRHKSLDSQEHSLRFIGHIWDVVAQPSTTVCAPPIYLIAQAGLLPLAEMLLIEGAEVDATGGNSGSPLQAAAKTGNLEMVELLLANGASVRGHGVWARNSSTSWDFPLVGGNKTPLTLAADEGHLQVMRCLIEKEREILIKGEAVDRSYLGDALGYAVEHGRDDCVSLLLKYNADTQVLRLGFLDSSTVLHVATRFRHAKIVKDLIEKGADVTARDRFGDMPLHLAVRHCDTDTVSVILRYAKQDVDTRSGYGHITPTVASWLRDSGGVEGRLLQQGADTQAEGYYNASRMYRLAVPVVKSQKAVECVNGAESLVESSASVSIPGYDRTTPLLQLTQTDTAFASSASEAENLEMMKLLIARGAMVQKQDAGGRTILHHAVIRGWQQHVRWLLGCAGLVHDIQDCDGKTALFHGCELGRETIVRQLLDSGAVGYDLKDKNGCTAIQAAAMNTHAPVLLALLTNGVRFYDKTQNGVLILHEILHGRHSRRSSNSAKSTCVKILLEHGASPTVLCHKNRTLLHCTIGCRDQALSKLLLDSCKLDVHARDDDGTQALHLATALGDLDMIKLLINHGSKVNDRDIAGRTALHLISPNRRDSAGGEDESHEITWLLLARGARVTVLDRNCFSPLHNAIDKLLPSVLELMIRVCPNASRLCSTTGATPLHLVCQGCRGDVKAISASVRMARILLASGADVSAADCYGRTPLAMLPVHLQRTFHHTQEVGLLRLLLDAGANPMSAGCGNKIILALARHGHTEEIGSLLSKGAGVHATDERWRTPLHLATAGWHDETAKMLVDHGADIASRDWEGNTAMACSSSFKDVRVSSSRFQPCRRKMPQSQHVLSRHHANLNSHQPEEQESMSCVPAASSDGESYLVRYPGSEAGSTRSLFQDSNADLDAEPDAGSDADPDAGQESTDCVSLHEIETNLDHGSKYWIRRHSI